MTDWIMVERAVVAGFVLAAALCSWLGVLVVRDLGVEA